MIAIPCRRCGSTQLRKNGRTGSGQQKFHCKACNFYGTLDTLDQERTQRRATVEKLQREPQLEKHHFTATFFIMTITLDKPNYLSSDQIKALDRMGMTIGAHTWDHHRVTRYTDADWDTQIADPTAQLAQITGHPINYFAYPYGLWNDQAISHLKRAGFVAAFQLESDMDRAAPLLTLRRVVANGFWTI